MDPNCQARVHSEKIWKRYLENRNVAIFILVCNFFFAILPGVLYFATNVRLVQEEDETLERSPPNVQSIVDWLAFLFVVFPIFVSFWQMFVFHRLISLRMTRTFFFGQCISLALYGMCFSKPLLRRFAIFKRKQTIPVLTILLILAIYIGLFFPYLFLFSEIRFFHSGYCSSLYYKFLPY